MQAGHDACRAPAAVRLLGLGRRQRCRCGWKWGKGRRRKGI